ncbi:MAG: SDR family NAD(P)-dependent oxidoreductase, partial [Leptospira sp.]|nr:SDR family NAD(P)-dependent oxidoreductase [Leptospira sp.]
MLKSSKSYITQPKKIAIITGASSGMGAEFARQIDSEEKLDEIWLIARRKKNLDAVAKKLRTPVVIIDADLSRKDTLLSLNKR